MQLSYDSKSGSDALPFFQRYLAPVSAVLGLAFFLSLPFSLSAKAHAFLHGICAQRPSHTLAFGDGLLPFDARMTGIYTGFLAAFVVLLAAGRHRRAGMPGLAPGIVLLVLLGTMAIDGFNSLFTDAGLSTPYEPSNYLRLLTGMAAGVGLATMLVMLIGMSLWRRPRVRERVVERWWEPLALYGAGLPLLLVMMSGWTPLLVPATLLLLSSAIVAFGGLATVSILLASGRENRYDRATQAQLPIVLGGIAGVIVIGLLAAGRFAFEAWSNVPPLT